MNILFFSSVFFPAVGGAQVTLNEMATRLANEDNNVTLVLPLGFYLKNFGSINKFNYSILPCLPFRFINWSAEGGKISSFLLTIYFLCIFKILKIDLVQTFYIYPNGFVLDKICKIGNVAHVTRAVGDDIQRSSSFSYGLIPKKYSSELSTFFHSSNTIFLALSDTVRKDFLNLTVPEKSIKHFPCGVDLEYFDKIIFSTDERKELRSSLGVNCTDFLFITVGRAHPKKGFDVLIKSLPDLRMTFEGKFKVLFVGPDMQQMERLSKELGVRDLCIFYGTVSPAGNQAFKIPNEELVKLYKASDACVFPSLLETFALIYIEAMAAGLPVIGTDAPGCGELLSHNIDSLVAKAGDQVSLTNLMNLLSHDNFLRERLKIEGRKMVQKHYDWEYLAKDISNFYVGLIKRQRK